MHYMMQVVETRPSTRWRRGAKGQERELRRRHIAAYKASVAGPRGVLSPACRSPSRNLVAFRGSETWAALLFVPALLGVG